MRRGLTAGVVLLLVLAGALFAFLRSQSSSTTVSAVFPTAIGVYVGSDVRMLGVKVGRIDSIVPQGQTVKVTMTVDSGTRVAADSTAVAIAPSVVSDRYIQLVPARRGAPTMASGATIPVGRTKTPVELDEIYAGLQKITTALGPDGANSTGSLSRLLTTAAKNLKGNGSQVNTTITEFGKAASTLDNSQADLFGTVSNLKTFNDTLAQNDAGITTVNSQLASVSGYLAQDRQDYALAVSQLSQALAQVQASSGTTARRSRPTSTACRPRPRPWPSRRRLWRRSRPCCPPTCRTSSTHTTRPPGRSPRAVTSTSWGRGPAPRALRRPRPPPRPTRRCPCSCHR